MKLFALKNKKGVALTYAVMMLLLLSTIIVAITALASTSYTSATNSVAGDQAYYYAKSIGLAVKQQFLEGYDIDKVLASLDAKIAAGDLDPKVQGKYTIESENGSHLVEGSVSITYTRGIPGSYDYYSMMNYRLANGENYNPYSLDVRVACLHQGALGVVTSIFTCEDSLTSEAKDRVFDALDKYDVVLTNTKDTNFGFADSSSDSSSLNIYVYAGESDAVVNPEFKLQTDLNGMLTTSGQTTIHGYYFYDNQWQSGAHEVKHGLTSYGNLNLTYVDVLGSKGIHSTGNVHLMKAARVENHIYARGDVTIDTQPPAYANNYENGFRNDGTCTYYTPQSINAICKNIYSQGAVTIGAKVSVNGNIVARKRVEVQGELVPATDNVNPNGLRGCYYTFDANGNATNCYFRGGNTYINGGIYTDGDVEVRHGAYVNGDIIALGDIMITHGAIVKGNVISLNGNVSVMNTACVGGNVWAKKNLTLGIGYPEATEDPDQSHILFNDYINKWWTNVSSWGFGVPGIGILTGSEHHCGQLLTFDVGYTSLIKGNIYVHGEDPNLGVTTNFGAIWIYGAVHLENTRATFTKFYTKNRWNNFGTIIYELYQHTDLYSGNSAGVFLNLYGAKIGKIVCQKGSVYYDVWIERGTLECLPVSDGVSAGIYARSVGLNNMDVGYGYNVNARQWLQTAGYATNEASQYTYAHSAGTNLINSGLYTENFTVFRGNNVINVRCLTMSGYDGWATDGSAYGETYNSAMGCELNFGVVMLGTVTVRVGQTDPVSGSVFRIRGGNAIYANIFACVDAFTLSGNSALSRTTGESTAHAHYARIQVVANTFTLTATPSVAPPIGMSKLFIHGNVTLQGTAYSVYHYEGSFKMEGDSKIKKLFWSKGEGEIALKGSFGDISLYNSQSVFKPAGTVTVNGNLLLAGTYNNKQRYTVTVNGNMRVGNLTTSSDGEKMFITKVTGNLTVIGSEAGIPLTLGSFAQYGASTTISPTVGGELYTENVSLSLNASVSIKRVYCATGSSLTVSGASITESCYVTGSLLFMGGTLSGPVKTNKFEIRGGTLNGSYSTILDCKSFRQLGGAIKKYQVYVSGSNPTGGTAVHVTAGTAESVQFRVTKGGVSITGGAALNYSAVKTVAAGNVTIAGSYSGGASADGNLTVGIEGETGQAYSVGSLFGGNGEQFTAATNNYYVFYAGKKLTWTGKAKAIESQSPYGKRVPVTAKEDVVIGSSSNVIPGAFDIVTSVNGSVTIYAQSVNSIKAKTNAYAHLTTKCGATNYSGAYGIDAGSNITLAGGGAFYGNYVAGGTITVANQIGARARFKCADVSGLDKIKTEKSAETSNYGLQISLYLTGYKNRTFTLTKSLVKDVATNANTGSITVDPGNLSFSNSVKVEGEIWVDGIFTYNGSTENLVSLGGIRCANTKVNVAKEFKGSIDLPNVTSITLNAKVSGKLYAPNVTSVTLNYDVENVASFPKVTSLTIASGRKVGGIVIKSTGTVTNNGTVTGVKDKNGNITSGGVECGYYTGSGTIQGGSKVNLIINGTSTVTIAGTTQCNIWSNAPLKFNAVTVGASGTYVYSKKKIEANGTKFNSGMAYILSSGGDADFTNCTSLPSVQNSSGRIMFKNDSSHKGTIKEVISSGTYISFGTSGSDNYQTVTGNVDWYGNRSGSWGIDGWKTNNQANTVINGYLNAYGTGNVWFGYKLGGNLALMNTGTASLAVGRIGGELLVNKAASKPVSSLTWDSGASVAGQAILYGTKNGNLSSVTTGGTVGEDLYCDGFSSVTVSGKVSGTLVGMSCDTITSNAELNSARMQLNGGTFISNKKCNGNVVSFNSHLTINADVGGNVALTADIFGFWCELGTMSKTITVGGTIKVRGVLVDNSHNKSTINVSGFYFGDVMKEWNECGQLSYTVENGGFCLITSPKKNPDDYPNACKMKSRLDIKGWLILISYSSSRKMHFYGDVYCNALTANTTAFSHNGNLGTIGSAFGRVSSSVRECGGNVWSGANTSTSKSLIYFHKPVFVKNDDENTYLGVCHAANCNFAAGSTLITDGQVCLTSCYLTSKGFESSTGRHCFTNGNQVTDYKDSSGAWQMDGSLFAHRYADSTGINVLSNVETESNVCFYNGYTYLLDGTNLKGVQIAASSNGTGVTGSIYSKMFYFGAGLELSGTSSARSRISSVPPKYEHTTPQARTIIWVETGNLSVGENCYIGKWVTKSQMTSGTEYLPAKELSSNPGVFVTAGAAWVHGTCTLDICAYDGIVVEKSGVVSGKDYQSSGTRYFAGFYMTAGYIYVKKTDGNWYTGKSNNADDLAGFFGYFKCKENGRNFWASNTGDGPTDRSAYRPDGAKYASMLASNVNRSTTQNYNSIYYTPNGSNEKITNIKSSGVVSATLKELKRNNFTPYSIPNPFPTRLSVRSNPAKPSVTGEEDASGGQMAKLDIKISVEPWAKGTLSFGEASISPTKVDGPINVADFQKLFSVAFDGAGGSVKKQSSSQSGLKHPSSMWTDSVAKNFDEQNEDYWNVRLIPYVWTLPYANSNALSGYNNPSKRVLNMKYQTSVGISLKWGNAKVTEGGQTYLLAEKAWNGSGLKSEIGDIVSSLKNSKGEIVYDGIKRRSTSGEDRITDILIFESGELDYDAFVMGQGDDYANWNRSTRTSQASSSSVSVWGFTIPLDSTKWYSIPHSGLHGNHMKDVMRSPQWAWYQGGPIGSYDIVWYFFACENPLDPYGSKPKDLHVIMPQGYGLEWYYDNENTFTVIGKGRVFLYFTSGNSFYFYGKNTDSTKPFGTVRKVDGKYQPQLYIIGAGTNIDFILDGMPFYAYAYMPFGWSTDLYYPQGSLGVLNTWNDLANPGGFFGTTKYTKNQYMQTTPVNRNALTLGIDNGGKKRLIVGKYVVDNFYYAPNGSNKLTFVKAAPPDLSDTTIYSRSVMKNGKMTFGTGTKYSLSTFMTLPPNFSTQMLDWKYVSIRVEG